MDPNDAYPKSFQLPSTPSTNVRDIRTEPATIDYFKSTGQFRPYMQEFVDSKTRPFIAWDGEGYTDYADTSAPGFPHKYALLMCSTGANIVAPQLTSLECLELILKVGAENPKAIHIIYAGGYDTTHWLRDLPLDLTNQLKDDNPIIWTVKAAPGITANVFTINYLPHKWTKIRGYDWYSQRWITVKIFDIMTFFQSSALAAWDSRNIPVPDIVREGKASRPTFDYTEIEQVREYCAVELDLYVILANTLRQEMHEAGIYVTQFHGPAVIAKAMFRKYGVRKHMGAPPTPEIERAAQYAYHAGHFELYQAGHHDGPVWHNDLNSAYPHALRLLPSLRDARWEWVDHMEGNTPGIWHVSYTDPTRRFDSPQPLPWRGKAGIIGYPNHNPDTWAYTPEASLPGVEVHGGWILRTNDTTRPFAYLEQTYNLRREWKAQKRGGQNALRLGMNSSYGGTAQRVGGLDTNGGRPSWHNLVWAGMITSITRRMLWDAIQLAPQNVISVETDSIMSTAPLQLDIGDELGQWDEKEYEWVTYLQNGIYLTPDGGTVKSKTRGIDVKELDHAQILDFLAGPQNEPLLVTNRQFIGLGNPRTYLYGQWQDSTKDVRVGGGKRYHNRTTCPQCANGINMAEQLHPLELAPHYGNTPSAPHPLPWVDGTREETDELMYAGDAIETLDVERRRR